MHYRRLGHGGAVCWMAIASALSLSGCHSAGSGQGYDFEGNFVERAADDINGVPTYTVLGPLRPGEMPDNKIAKVMSEACPTGNPRLLWANEASSQITGDGPKLWGGGFTCNQPIR